MHQRVDCGISLIMKTIFYALIAVVAMVAVAVSCVGGGQQVAATGFVTVQDRRAALPLRWRQLVVCAHTGLDRAGWRQGTLDGGTRFTAGSWHQ